MSMFGRSGALRFVPAFAAAALVSGCIGAAGSAAPAPPTVSSEGELAGLDEYVAQAVDAWGLAGLSIAVVKDDAVVFAQGYGEREVGGGHPVDENTIFAIGSNTKVFTAVAAGMMVDGGLMEWDDPATRHLPDFQLHDPYVTRDITLRDLLSHRSGLGRRGDMLWYGSEYDRAEILRRVRFLEPNASFRAEFGYQNIMFLAAGEATAVAAGRSWDALVRERIFQPLGMRRSSTSTRDLAGIDNVAAPHVWTDAGLAPVPWRNLDNVAPAGSINSSAREMAEWLRLLLDEGRYDGASIVEPETLAEIFTPHTLIPVSPDSLFPSVHFMAYGLGLVLQDYRDRKLLWHTGGIDGMLSLIALVPEEELGIVVLTNTGERNNLYTALMYSVVDAYLGGETRDWSSTLLRRTEASPEAMAQAQQEAAEARAAGTRPSLEPEGYVGRYRHPMYGEASVALEDGRLVLRRGPAFSGDLEHWHHDTFRATWRDPGMGSAQTTFTLDALGKVRTMQIQGIALFDKVNP